MRKLPYEYTLALQYARAMARNKARYDPVDDEESWDKLADEVILYTGAAGYDVRAVFAAVRIQYASVRAEVAELYELYGK